MEYNANQYQFKIPDIYYRLHIVFCTHIKNNSVTYMFPSITTKWIAGSSQDNHPVLIHM